jgi:hypothetical protein
MYLTLFLWCRCALSLGVWREKGLLEPVESQFALLAQSGTSRNCYFPTFLFRREIRCFAFSRPILLTDFRQISLLRIPYSNV